MRRSILLALLAALLLPAAAPAAPAKLSPRASAVSATGVTTIEAANPNRYALRGTAAVLVRGRSIASRTVRLGRRSVSTLTLRLGERALVALRGAGGRATVVLRLRRPGGRTTTARRTLTLRLPHTPAPGGQAPSRPGTGDPATGTPPAPPAPPASNRWTGRMGTEGPYDDLELTLADGQLQITRAPVVPVSCYENGSSPRIALSLELFDAPGPWTVGTDASVEKQGLAVNQLVSGGARTITYKVSGTTQDAGRVAGTLGMSFVDSKYDIFTNRITVVTCAGTQSFEAVPAG